MIYILLKNLNQNLKFCLRLVLDLTFTYYTAIKYYQRSHVNTIYYYLLKTQNIDF